MSDIQQLQFDKEQAQAYVRKIMDELRSKYPAVKFQLTETTYDDAAYGNPVTVFHKIEITATI
jgi:hypothetical protein